MTVDADVIVVGAGLAGLIAARDLDAAGAGSIVLEAADRVGGRTYSLPFPGTDRIVDLGAEWVSARHTSLLAEYARYGIVLEPEPDGGVYWNIEGRVRSGDVPLEGSDLDSLLIVTARLDELARTDDAGDDDRSFAELVAECGTTSAAAVVLEAACFALMGCAAGECSARALAEEARSFDGSAMAAFFEPMQRVVGGADLLARRLAGRLDVRLDHRVIKVRDGHRGVELDVLDGSSLRCRAVVVAVPLNVLAAIDFEPALPVPVARLAAEGHAGRAAKAWFRATGVPGAATAYAPPLPTHVYTIETSPGQTLVGAFAYGADADALHTGVGDALRPLFPDITVTGEALFHDWNADPNTAGTWLAVRPGRWRAHRGLLANLETGRLVLAGGDVAAEWAGWMEGAVRSGRRAALSALHRP